MHKMYDNLNRPNTDSATCTHPNVRHSACETCSSVVCMCDDDNPLKEDVTPTPVGCAIEKSEPEENFEYHLVDIELSSEFPAKMKAYSVLDTRNSFDKALDKISDGVIYVSVLFMQTLDKICDRFLKAYKEGRP